MRFPKLYKLLWAEPRLKPFLFHPRMQPTHRDFRCLGEIMQRNVPSEERRMPEHQAWHVRKA